MVNFWLNQYLVPAVLLLDGDTRPLGRRFLGPDHPCEPRLEFRLLLDLIERALALFEAQRRTKSPNHLVDGPTGHAVVGPVRAHNRIDDEHLLVV